MSTVRYPFVIALIFVLGLLALSRVEAGTEEKKIFDRQVLRVVTDTAYIDTTAADYTSFQNLLEFAPDNNNAAYDVKIVIDLDKATTGFAEATGYDTETIQFAIARKVDGTNWRPAENLKAPATAIAADNADNLAIELDVGVVNPTEGLRVYVKLSAEAQADVALPFVLYYRSGASATVTPVTN